MREVCLPWVSPRSTSDHSFSSPNADCESGLSNLKNNGQHRRFPEINLVLNVYTIDTMCKVDD